MPCTEPGSSADICLTKEQTLGQIIKLLPRGRAWRTDEDTPVRLGVLRAIASLYAFIEERLCALRLEFFCETESETHEIWLEQYGLPAPCDPYPDLCTKVAAIGGTRCEYYVEIAKRAGWAIECAASLGCGAIAGCAFAGTAQTGQGPVFSTLNIKVFLDQSPAYQAGPRTPSLAGRMLAGWSLSCLPDIGALECLLARAVHAHVLVVYEIVDEECLVADVDYDFAAVEVDVDIDFGLASDFAEHTLDYGSASCGETVLDYRFASEAEDQFEDWGLASDDPGDIVDYGGAA